ncbi:hypothetical protein ACI789_18565 [Geodermatophilus sp. SYSU D00965]
MARRPLAGDSPSVPQEPIASTGVVGAAGPTGAGAGASVDAGVTRGATDVSAWVSIRGSTGG